MITSIPFVSDLAALRDRLDGELVIPGDVNWDAARQAWNLAVDQHPEAVVLPRSAEDVRAVVEAARAAGLRIAMQGTGHNARPLGSLEGTVLVKTSEMRGVTIDARNRIARVEAGALWADVTRPASEAGLAPLAGSSPDVGVVGYTLGGGLSWLGRRYGLASERVLAIELVTADGRLVRADRQTETDLFWALRGGGGSFAAVTAMEFELLPVEEVYAGMLLWPWERAREVMQAWREWTATAPETATTAIRIMQFPPLPELPDFLRGRGVVVVDGAVLADPGEAADVLAPLRALGPEMDTFAVVPPAALSHIHMDPEHPVPGMSDTAMLAELPAEAVDALVDVAGHESGSPLMMAEIRHLGGALSRPGTGALGSLPAPYVMFNLGIPMGPAVVEAVEAHFATVRATLAPYTSPAKYSNFAERTVDPASLYQEDAYARLQAVKATVDPDGLFRGNHDIRAAA